MYNLHQTSPIRKFLPKGKSDFLLLVIFLTWSFFNGLCWHTSIRIFSGHGTKLTGSLVSTLQYSMIDVFSSEATL